MSLIPAGRHVFLLFWAMGLLCLGFSPAVGAAGREAGTVISLAPGAFVERDGVRKPLAVKDKVCSGDVLVTDATGRLRVWMRDETTLSLGSDTEFDIEEYNDEGSKPAFKSKMTGMARMLTGQISRTNPDGFKVATPEATVGIRGTILAVQSREGRTTVFVENTLRQVMVNGVVVPSGSKGLVPAAGAAPRISPMTPQDRRNIGSSVAAKGGSSSTAGGGAAGAVAGLAGGAGAPGGLAGGALSPVDKLLAENGGLAVDDVVKDADDKRRSLDVLPVMAHYERVNGLGGSMESAVPGRTLTNGEFAFDVNFRSGAVTNASLTVQYGHDQSESAADFLLSGGRGTVKGNAFTVNTFANASVRADVLEDAAANRVTGRMSGSIAPGTLAMQGTYSVTAASSSNETASGGLTEVKDYGVISGLPTATQPAKAARPH